MYDVKRFYCARYEFFSNCRPAICRLSVRLHLNEKDGRQNSLHAVPPYVGILEVMTQHFGYDTHLRINDIRQNVGENFRFWGFFLSPDKHKEVIYADAQIVTKDVAQQTHEDAEDDDFFILEQACHHGDKRWRIDEGDGGDHHAVAVQF